MPGREREPPDPLDAALRPRLDESAEEKEEEEEESHARASKSKKVREPYLLMHLVL